MKINVLRGGWRAAIAAALLIVAQAGMAASEKSKPIVIGESFPKGPDYFPITNRIELAANTYIDYINSIGGINGRKVELVTLDDGNDPKRYAANIRTLIRDNGAIAIINCFGDEICKVGAGLAAQEDDSFHFGRAECRAALLPDHSRNPGEGGKIRFR